MRAHKLEGLLNKDSGCQFKAWKLNVNESLSLPSPEEINRDCILTKEIHFTAKFPSAVRPETIDNYQVGEFGYVVYFSEKQQMYVPTHIFERL